MITRSPFSPRRRPFSASSSTTAWASLSVRTNGTNDLHVGQPISSRPNLWALIMQMNEKRNIRFLARYVGPAFSGKHARFRAAGCDSCKAGCPGANPVPSRTGGCSHGIYPSETLKRLPVGSRPSSSPEDVNFAFFQVSAPRHDLEPVDITQCLRRAIEAVSTMTAVVSARDSSHVDRYPAALRCAGQTTTPPVTSNWTAARVSAIGLSSRLYSSTWSLWLTYAR